MPTLLAKLLLLPRTNFYATVFQDLRTVIYPAPQLAEATAFYTQVLGQPPYFQQPFYVGFQVAGFELGLDPNAPAGAPVGGVAYWGVPDAAAAYTRLLALGATAHEAVRDVGEGILVATVLDPCGNVLGIIQNPHF